MGQPVPENILSSDCGYKVRGFNEVTDILVTMATDYGCYGDITQQVCTQRMQGQREVKGRSSVQSSIDQPFLDLCVDPFSNLSHCWLLWSYLSGHDSTAQHMGPHTLCPIHLIFSILLPSSLACSLSWCPFTT